MITITDTELEKTLLSLLQKHVMFVIHKKQWRSGTVLLFKQNGFYIEFVIKNKKGKLERFEIPIPFNVVKYKDYIKFSYELTSLICNDQDIILELKKIEPDCRSKYFNSYLEVYVK
jgi:hypothetical protein